MRVTLLASAFVLIAGAASAGTISYNTTGSTLSCNGVGSCVQNTSTSITIGGLTETYNSGSGSSVVTPSIINFGNLVSTGTGNGVNFSGVMLTINVNSTPPGSSGAIPNGAISGSISVNSSSAFITFSPSTTATSFGLEPGVVIGSGASAYAYGVLNATLGLQAPTVGNPIGQTSIQGTVTDVSTVVTTPEPVSIAILSVGLIGLGVLRRRR